MSKLVEKNCEYHCPQCGANGTRPKYENIEWGSFEEDDSDDPHYYISGKCFKCGCEFKEFYTYDPMIYTKTKYLEE